MISIILETNFIAATAFFELTILTSLAIYDLLSEYLKEEIKIKWPNDLMFGKSKIGGILIENYLKKNVIEWCVAGVGLNINQGKFQDERAISLAHICGQEFDREEIINLLLQKVEARYFQVTSGKIESLKKEYLSNRKEGEANNNDYISHNSQQIQLVQRINVLCLVTLLSY